MSVRAFWLLAALLPPMAGWCTPTTLTYQGQLQQAGAEFTGAADLEFRLFDQETDGVQVGPTVPLNDWPVVDGLFQVELDFGSVYGENPRWLQVTVDGFDLTPRQAVRPAPVALYALAGNDWQLDGSNVYYSAGNVGIGTSTPAAALEVRSDSGIGTPQLLLTESHDDYARFTFANSVSDRFWTLAALTRGVTPGEDRFNLFHSTSGDVIRVNGEGNVGLGSHPTSIYRINVRDGMLVTRDTGPGLLAHLAISETAGSEPVRQLFWNSAAARGWRIDSAVEAAGVADDRLTLHNTGAGDVFTLSGSGAAGVGFTDPPAALSVYGSDAWTWTSGNGRGDFYIGDGLVGLSMGVALGGGGRGVSRIWTNGGVENLFIGSAAHGVSLSVLPGQVGVNNTNPGNTLDVDGGVRIRSFSHADSSPRVVRVEANGDLVAAAPPENYLSISPVAFNPERSGVDFQHVPYLRVTSTTVGTPFSTPLYFEDGTNPSELRIWYEDNDSNKNLRIVLCRGSFGTNNCGSDAIATTDSVTSGVEELAVPFTGPNIDNSANAYKLRVYTVDNSGVFTDWSSDLRLYAARVSYTPP